MTTATHEDLDIRLGELTDREKYMLSHIEGDEYHKVGEVKETVPSPFKGGFDIVKYENDLFYNLKSLGIFEEIEWNEVFSGLIYMEVVQEVILSELGYFFIKLGGRSDEQIKHDVRRVTNSYMVAEEYEDY